MERKEFVQKMGEVGLERVAEKIADDAMDCVAFESKPMGEGETVSVGVSKLGGDPDVPKRFVWPEYKGVKLAFLAQLNLAEVPRQPVGDRLPVIGLLSFFYHPDQISWGFDPKDKGSWASYYFPDIGGLERMETPPLEAEYFNKSYEECKVSFVNHVSYPDANSESIELLNFSDKEFHLYNEYYSDLTSIDPHHQILGHPYTIQGPMGLECQLASNGINYGKIAWKKNRRAKQLAIGSKDWRLLFQLDTDDNANMMWGDVGSLYFWMRDTDIVQRNFSNTWMVLQCY